MHGLRPVAGTSGSKILLFKVRAHQQQDDVRTVELVVDLAVQILAGADSAIMPSRDDAVATEPGKVLLEFVAQRFVGVRIGEEDMGHGRWVDLLGGSP